MTTLLELAAAARVPVENCDRSRLDRMTHNGRHQGVVAETAQSELGSEKELELRWPTLQQPLLLLALDGVMDPRNLGACLRSADAAGVGAVLLPKSRTAPLSEVARKSASGAAESLFTRAGQQPGAAARMAEAAGRLGGGRRGDADVTWDAADLTRPTVLVLGGEGKGLRDLTRKTCDQLVSVPMRGAVSSLNVRSRPAFCCSKRSRQRASA